VQEQINEQDQEQMQVQMQLPRVLHQACLLGLSMIRELVLVLVLLHRDLRWQWSCRRMWRCLPWNTV
jgi:hypothetical protein